MKRSTRRALARGSASARSSPGRRCRTRASGAAAAAASRSASAKTTLADLPPSSSVTRLIVCAAPAAIERADLGRAGEGDLARRPGARPAAAPHVRPGPTTTLTTPSGMPASQRELGEAQRGQRRQLGGLEHDRVARPRAPARASRGDRQREVPRRDQPDDAERLADGERLPAGDGDRVAEQPLGRAGVVAEGVDDHRRSRRARRRSACRRCAPRARASSSWRVLQRAGQRAQQPRAVARGERAPGRAAPRARARPPRRPPRRPRAGLCEHRLGGGLEDLAACRSSR